MGRMHFGCWSQLPEAQVAAVCDANPDIMSSFTKTLGNIPGLPDAINPATVTLYNSLDQMIRTEQLDAVSVTLPTHLHADISCQLLREGLHVLCEKPMALNTAQCDQMIAAAAQVGKKLMIGQCIRFWPAYAAARDIIQSGQYGKVYSARFERFTSRPSWSSGNWLMDGHKSGGMPLDLHIHDADYIQSLFGMPVAVSSRALHEPIDHIETRYHYDSCMLVSAAASWLASGSFGFRMNFEVLLEQATIGYDSSRDPAFVVYPNDGQPFTPPLSQRDGYWHEIDYFSKWIQGTIDKERITLDDAKQSVRLIEAEIQSCRNGKRIALEDMNEEIAL
jgi:predicted dehydrogenase